MATENIISQTDRIRYGTYLKSLECWNGYIDPLAEESQERVKSKIRKYILDNDPPCCVTNVPFFVIPEPVRKMFGPHN